MAFAPPVFIDKPIPITLPAPILEAAPPVFIDDAPAPLLTCDKAKALGIVIPWSAPYTVQQNGLCGSLIASYELENAGELPPISVQPVIPSTNIAALIAAGIILWISTR